MSLMDRQQQAGQAIFHGYAVALPTSQLVVADLQDRPELALGLESEGAV